MTDGGPAFPSPLRPEDGFWNAQGMSLRDWFAGQALAGLVVIDGSLNLPRSPTEAEIERARAGYRRNIARIAYDYADAMLAARARRSAEESNA